MRISLGRGIGKCMSKQTVTKVTLYCIRRDPEDSSSWETPKELMDYIQSLFGPGIKDI